MRGAMLLTVLLAFPVAGGAVPLAPQVQVSLGPALQARANELGHDDLEAMRADFASQLREVAAKSDGRIESVSLVIEDIQPNRPTSAQLGRSVGLSASSFGLGGAAITGTVRIAGAARPLRYRFFPTDRRLDMNFTTWGDAEQAFETVARDLSKGDVPDDASAWPAPRGVQPLTGTRLPG